MDHDREPDRFGLRHDIQSARLGKEGSRNERDLE